MTNIQVASLLPRVLGCLEQLAPQRTIRDVGA